MRHILSVAVVEKIVSTVSGDLELYGFMNYHHLNNKQQNWWKMSIIIKNCTALFIFLCVFTKALIKGRVGGFAFYIL